MPDGLSFVRPLLGIEEELGSRKVTVLEDLMVDPAEFTVVNGMTPTDLEQGQETTTVVVITVLEPCAFVVVSTLNTVDKAAVEVILPLPALAP